MLAVLPIMSDSTLMPQGECYLWQPSLMGLHVVSDLAIALAYLLIPLLFAYLHQQYPNLFWHKSVRLWCIVAIAFSITHLMVLWTFWHPEYWLSGLVKGLTAGIFLYTIGALVPWLEDITDAKLAEGQLQANLNDALNQLNREIEKRQQMDVYLREREQQYNTMINQKSRLVSITSHELRTPLTTILSTAELLEYYEWTKAEERQQLHLIQDTVQQMLQLLEDMLFMGTAESGQLPFKPVPLDLNEFCLDLIREIQHQLDLKRQSRDISYTLTFVSPGQHCLACIDHKLLRQLLSNLLLNAIKYSPDGGTIQLELACKEEDALFQIQDRGIGIPKEDQPHLFEFFHRGKNVGEIEGTGLGLAIVKTCVDLHGGQIAVNSEVGVGTTFTVTLPLGRLQDQLSEQS